MNNMYPRLHGHQYIPLSDVAFAPLESTIVMPHQLPPNSMRFPNAPSNRMLNIPDYPNIISVYHGRRVQQGT